MTKSLHWTAGIHHDGSELYVSNPLPELGETVTISLRVPKQSPIRHIFLRTAPDGENHFEQMTIARKDTLSAWWTASLRVTMPHNPYRFKILTDEGAYFYDAEGVSRADSPDWTDFKLLADYDAPTWVQSAVFYQIFPDRFYNGDPSLTVPVGSWERRGFATTQRAWGEQPLHFRQGGNVDFYGGDIPGIVEKLDYLQSLGITALYLNPIFASESNHRYDITDFGQIDRYLGGNEALATLRQALDKRNMHLILDITPNHLSWSHPWFKAAQDNAQTTTAEYFTFYEHPDEYEKWMGVPSLVKLNYSSHNLRNAMYRTTESAMRRWLREPYRIDGWRLDVLNMMARQGAMQLHHEVGREIRQAIKADNPQAYIMGEHFFDGSTHLQGDELDAVQNYQGFTFPLRRWLAGKDLGVEWNMPSADPIPMPAEAMDIQLRRYRAAVPWVIARQQFNQLGSHDISRILTTLNSDKALARLAAVVLTTYVGVPCIYYGDEVGMEGNGDPDNRRTMVWDEAEQDRELWALHQRLNQLRQSSDALINGGYQTLFADNGLIVFQRHSAKQRLLIVGYRGPDDLPEIQIPVWHGDIPDGTPVVDMLSDKAFTVRDGQLTLYDLTKGDALILEVTD